MINTIQQNNSILNVNLMKGSQQKTALIDNLVIQNVEMRPVSRQLKIM